MSRSNRARPAFRRAVLPMVVAAAVAASWSLPSAASSHREAPFIATQPKVDGTDFYMFRSYEPGRAGYVTLIANYLPLQDPYGGPNYFTLDPNALYEIHIDNNGDARRGPHLPVPLPEHARRQPAHRRRQDGVDPADAERLGRRQPTPDSPRAQRRRDATRVDVIRGDRRTGNDSSR